MKSNATALKIEGFDYDYYLVIERDAAISNLGNRIDLYNRYLDKFLNTYSNSADETASMMDSGRKDEAVILVHSIKGLSGTLGLTGLFRAATELEASIRADLDYSKPMSHYSIALNHCISESKK